MKKITVEITIPKRIEKYFTAKVLQDILNIRWGGGFDTKFKVKEKK